MPSRTRGPIGPEVHVGAGRSSSLGTTRDNLCYCHNDVHLLDLLLVDNSIGHSGRLAISRSVAGLKVMFAHRLCRQKCSYKWLTLELI